VLTAVTVEVATVKVAVVPPAGMVTLGTVGLATEVLVEDRVTTIAPGAAGHSRVAVPATSAGPVNGVGERASEARPTGRTVRVTLLSTPPWLAVTVPACAVVTAGAE